MVLPKVSPESIVTLTGELQNMAFTDAELFNRYAAENLALTEAILLFTSSNAAAVRAVIITLRLIEIQMEADNGKEEKATTP